MTEDIDNNVLRRLILNVTLRCIHINLRLDIVIIHSLGYCI